VTQDELTRRRKAAVRAYSEALGGKEAAQAYLRALEALREYATVSAAPLGVSVFTWALVMGEEAAAAHRAALGLAPMRPQASVDLDAFRAKVRAAQPARLAQIARAKARNPAKHARERVADAGEDTDNG
jgi:hypothetical protein